MQAHTFDFNAIANSTHLLVREYATNSAKGVKPLTTDAVRNMVKANHPLAHRVKELVLVEKAA